MQYYLQEKKIVFRYSSNVDATYKIYDSELSCSWLLFVNEIRPPFLHVSVCLEIIRSAASGRTVCI